MTAVTPWQQVAKVAKSDVFLGQPAGRVRAWTPLGSATGSWGRGSGGATQNEFGGQQHAVRRVRERSGPTAVDRPEQQIHGPSARVGIGPAEGREGRSHQVSGEDVVESDDADVLRHANAPRGEPADDPEGE